MKQRGFISFQIGFILCFSVCFLWSCKVRQVHSCADIELEKGKISYVKKPSSVEFARISGTVTDIKNNEPIPLSRVLVDSFGKLAHGRNCKPTGEFEPFRLKEGKYKIRIEAEGYMFEEFPLKVKKPFKDVVFTVQLKQQVFVVEKPIIYIYPTQKQAVRVQLNFKGQLQHTYPAYPATGWNMIAEPNGTLYDEQGKEYYALFWEGQPQQALQASTGFVVAGKDCASFLEEKLAYLGLSRREANEFLLYWLPRMENNAYNFIHFADADYRAMAELNITPQPETLIRVMMLTKPLNAKMTVPEQDLSPLHKTRKGFTVVEWGGTMMETAL
ncbi:MAG: hypothetical protein ACR2IL_01275 [Chitinophagaceae bacterium]